MIPAAELKTGMILRIEKHLYPGSRRPRLRAVTHFGVQARAVPVGLHKILATEYHGLRKRERVKGPE